MARATSILSTSRFPACIRLEVSEGACQSRSLVIASEAVADAADAHFTARAWMQHANLLSSAATQFP